MSDDLTGFHVIEADIVFVEPIAEIQIKKSYKGLTGHWTKWGGARQEVAINQWGEVGVIEEWFCQSCTMSQPPELSPMRYEYPESEYIRVCATCFNNGCITLKDRLVLE